MPDHTTFSRRGRTFKLSRPLAELGDGPVDLIVDSSGLTLHGQQFHCGTTGTPTSMVTGSLVAGRSFIWL